jgi:predicted alpha/beta-fold hydrolase
MQTVIASQKPRRWDYGWKTWEPLTVDLGKHGKILAEVSWQPGPKDDAPALVLLHGLEGSARSPHLLGISKKAYEAGFHAIRLNMRNCGGTEHLTPTLYCAALSEDVLVTIQYLQSEFGIYRCYGTGISLGGNVLLKFAGELGEEAARWMSGLAVVSSPIDLALGAQTIGSRKNWLYERYFVSQLVSRLERKAVLYPDIADLRRARRARSIWEFDDLVTGPHFGYGSAENYYRQASSGPLLGRIRIPTLLIQAMDDPLIPFESYRNPEIRQNPFLRLLATREGGHAGFLAARPSGTDRDPHWAECRVIQFITHLARRPQNGSGKTSEQITSFRP